MSTQISRLARSFVADKHILTDRPDSGKPSVAVKPLVQELDAILALLTYSPEKARERLSDVRKTLHRFASVKSARMDSDVSAVLSALLVGSGIDRDAARKLEREAASLPAEDVLYAISCWASSSDQEELPQAASALHALRKVRVDLPPPIHSNSLHGESAYVYDLLDAVFI